MQSHLLEKAARVITSPQVLVNVISRRVRQLMDGHRPVVEVQPRMGLADIALSEVIEGRITYEHTPGFIPDVVVPRIAKLAELTPKKQAA
jgi:DNA-directed RNA polymerase subunit omega